MGIYSPQERWKDGKTTRLYMINSKGNKVEKKKKEPKTAERYNLGSISCNYVFTVVVSSLLTVQAHRSLFIAHRSLLTAVAGREISCLSLPLFFFFFFSFVNHMT